MRRACWAWTRWNSGTIRSSRSDCKGRSLTLSCDTTALLEWQAVAARAQQTCGAVGRNALAVVTDIRSAADRLPLVPAQPGAVTVTDQPPRGAARASVGNTMPKSRDLALDRAWLHDQDPMWRNRQLRAVFETRSMPGWKRYLVWCREAGAHHAADQASVSFVAEAPSPRIAWTTLRWKQQHLRAPLGLDEQRPSFAGLGALLASQSMVWGAMRDQHLLWSCSIFSGEHLLFCRCKRGKVMRTSFIWCLPRYTPSGTALGGDIMELWRNTCTERGRQVQYQIPDEAGQPLAACAAVLRTIFTRFYRTRKSSRPSRGAV